MWIAVSAEYETGAISETPDLAPEGWRRFDLSA
jgi:hypothetical protein